MFPESHRTQLVGFIFPLILASFTIAITRLGYVMGLIKIQRDHTTEELQAVILRRKSALV